MAARDREDVDEPGRADLMWSAEPLRGPRPRRRLTNRVMRAIKWCDRLPLTLSVGTLFLIAMALTLATLYVCYY